jgi:hypothetical protein
MHAQIHIAHKHTRTPLRTDAQHAGTNTQLHVTGSIHAYAQQCIYTRCTVALCRCCTTTVPTQHGPPPSPCEALGPTAPECPQWGCMLCEWTAAVGLHGPTRWPDCTVVASGLPISMHEVISPSPPSIAREIAARFSTLRVKPDGSAGCDLPVLRIATNTLRCVAARCTTTLHYRRLLPRCQARG